MQAVELCGAALARPADRARHQEAGGSLRSIEGLRLIASIAIIVSHFVPYALKHEPLGGGLRIFVDLFFVISGIVIATAYSGRVGSASEYGVYLQRRIARLYPLHLATMAVYVAIAAAAGLGLFRLPNPDRYAFDQLPLYLTMTHAWFGNGTIAWNGVSWSISAELAAYLLFPVILKLMKNGRAAGALAVAALLICAALIAQTMLGGDVTKLASKCSWLRAIPSFAAGVWLATNRSWLAELRSDTLRWVFYGSAALLAIELATDCHDSIRLLTVWVIVAAAYGCDLRARETIVSRDFISKHGKLTYSLYLIHPIIATTWLAFIAPRMGGFLLNSMWVALPIAFALTFVLARLSLEFLEEPARRFLSRPIRAQTYAQPVMQDLAAGETVTRR